MWLVIGALWQYVQALRTWLGERNLRVKMIHWTLPLSLTASGCKQHVTLIKSESFFAHFAIIIIFIWVRQQRLIDKEDMEKHTNFHIWGATKAMYFRQGLRNGSNLKLSDHQNQCHVLWVTVCSLPRDARSMALARGRCGASVHVCSVTDESVTRPSVVIVGIRHIPSEVKRWSYIAHCLW